MSARGALVAMLLVLPARAAELPSGTIQARASALKWTGASATMPAGTQVAVLEGDPKAPGLFTLRLKVPAGARIAPHWHPRDERVTVLSGTVVVGFGDAAGAGDGACFGAGDFYVNPARSRHYVEFPAESVVQVTGEGPWELHFLK